MITQETPVVSIIPTAFAAQPARPDNALTINDELGLFLNTANSYPNPLDAFYEYTKNAYEGYDNLKRADHLYVEVSFKRKEIVISGNAGGMNDREMGVILRSIGTSYKDSAHKGLGSTSFLAFADKYTLISKKGGHYYIFDCLPKDKWLAPNIDPRPMIPADREHFAHYCNRINKWADGSVTILHGVGMELPGRRPGLEIRETFKKTEVRKLLQTKYRSYLRGKGNELLLKFDDEPLHVGEKSEKITYEPGAGVELRFRCPSKRCPIDERRTIFTFNGVAYKISIEFNLRMSMSRDLEKDEMLIQEDGCNSEPMKQVFSLSRPLDRNSIFKYNPFSQYVFGDNDFVVTPVDPSIHIKPDLYSGSRSLRVTGAYEAFGNCLANMLMFADIEVIRPEIKKYVRSKESRRSDKEGHAITGEVIYLFKNNMNLIKDKFSRLLTTRSQSPVAKQTVECHSCNNVAEPILVGPAEFHTKRGGNGKDDMRILVCGNKYICCKCSNQWAKRTINFTGGGNGGKQEDPVISTKVATEPENTKPRQRSHGFGYEFHIESSMDMARRWWMRSETDIAINSNFPSYKEFMNEGSKSLQNYTRRIAATALVQRFYGDRPSYEQFELTNSLLDTLTMNAAKARRAAMNQDDLEEFLMEQEIEPEIKEKIQEVQNALPPEKQAAANQSLLKMLNQWGEKSGVRVTVDKDKKIN